MPVKTTRNPHEGQSNASAVVLPPLPVRPLAAGLYLVATPIGTLADISLRALQTLASAQCIACEDTRTSRVLLQHYGIQTPTMAYHDHSDDASRERLLQRIRGGQAVALISDAGTPLIADPGYKLVRQAVAEGLYVTAVPGASSVPVALSLSGLPTDAFYFGGFLPAKSHARREVLADVKHYAATLVFLESPHRIEETLLDAGQVLGSERQACLARELTKQFESRYGGSLAELYDRCRQEPNMQRGEMVLVIAGANREAMVDHEAQAKAALQQAMQHMRVKDAATAVAEAHGLPRKQVYQWALEMQDSSRGE